MGRAGRTTVVAAVAAPAVAITALALAVALTVYAAPLRAAQSLDAGHARAAPLAAAQLQEAERARATALVAALREGEPQEPEPCRAAPGQDGNARSALLRAVEAVGARAGRVLRFSAVERQVQDFQSDRPYPPYFSAFRIQEIAYDPRTGAEHHESRLVYPAMGPTPPRGAAVTATAAFLSAGDGLVAEPRAFDLFAPTRLLNPWAVLADWSAAVEGPRLAGECLYRDRWRLVLERPGRYAPERLYLDADSGFPVKLERLVPHPTWGQLREEYLWSTWHAVGEDGFFPTASFRLADGRVVLERTVGEVGVVSEAEAALPELPDAAPADPDPWLRQWTDQAPDTVRVADDVFLLAHPMYNGVLAGVGDTVYVMDATLSEARARQDSAWARRLFPDHRAVKLVVTDVAWPHVGGVRFWAARGATLVTHATSEPFLRTLIERRWTLRPDALERARGAAAPEIVTVDEQPLDLAGGRIRVVPVGGIGSEGAVMVWMPERSFLWAGDYVQLVDERSLYATEVSAAAEREGFRPSRVAAQHVPLTDWSVVEGANRR